MNIKFSNKYILWVVFALISFIYFVGVLWSFEPDELDIKQIVIEQAKADKVSPVVGYTTTTSLIVVAETLLNKSGGYLSNDVIPPSLFLDNIPSWEFGALEMVRDLALIMRKDLSRSQSQSLENKYLKEAQPKFNIDNTNWALPSAEGEYKKGIKELYGYRTALANKRKNNAQFYARADNLRAYLKEVEKRLGSYSQKLSTSVGKDQINTDLAGDKYAEQSTSTAISQEIKTSWMQLDNVFYEARGATWALLHFLKAIEIDFDRVLSDKNAKISVQQIIRELQSCQQPLYSPMILNGDGFGLMANHSLVMANYVSRANAALIDLNELLNKG